MNSQPNLSAIKAYADKFSDKVCTSFFADNEVIIGSQIVSFTGIEQVNYFIIRRIFEHWQEEMLKIQSPYFDYQSSSVKKAFGSLMNELSKNISIKREDFEVLVKEAVEDTLFFLLKPDDYLNELFSRQQKKLLDTQQYLVPLLRYMKVHKDLVVDLSSRFINEGELIEVQKVAQFAKRSFTTQKTNWEEPYPILQQFNDVLTVGIYELYPNYVSPHTELPTEAAKTEDSSFHNFFALDDSRDEEDLVNENVEEPTTPKEQSRLSRFLDLEEQEEDNTETFAVEEEPVKVEATPEAPILAVEEETLQEEAIPTFEEETQVEETGTQSLNEQLKAEEQSPTLLESLQRDRGVSLSESINLNMRFRFQTVLFDGNVSDYNEAIDMVDACPNYHTALTNLKDLYGQKFQWDYSSEEVMEFLSLVDEKF